jgi:hypothetical protein
LLLIIILSTFSFKHELKQKKNKLKDIQSKIQENIINASKVTGYGARKRTKTPTLSSRRTSKQIPDN